MDLRLQRIIALGGACMMLLGATACSASPVEDFVQLTDHERLTARVMANSLEEDNSVHAVGESTDDKTERRTGDVSLESEDGKLCVSMHEVPVLNADTAMPMAAVTLGSFTEKEVRAIVSTLLGDEAFFEQGEGIPTKADIQATIAQYKRYITEGTVNENTIFTEDELREEIERLEEECDSAPDTTLGSESRQYDGTVPELITDDGTLRVLNVTDAGERSILNIVSSDSPDSQDAMNSVFYLRDKDAVADEDAARDATVGETISETGLSYEDAVGMCFSLLAAAGVTDAVPSSQRFVDMGYGPAYEFQFVRSVNGVPAAHFQSAYLSEEDGTPPWEYERITIAVDKSGIEEIYWTDRTEMGEVLSENVKVLPYEDSQKVFEKMILAVYEPKTEWLSDDEHVEIEVDDVQLAPLRIREPNVQGRKGLYVPAWIYYGRVSNPAEKASALGPYDRRLILAVNAIDGSVIDMSKGY